MIEVTTKDELRKALIRNQDSIHIVNEKLSLSMITRPKKFRFINYVMNINGYRILKAKVLGHFDVKLVKNIEPPYLLVQ